MENKSPGQIDLAGGGPCPNDDEFKFKFEFKSKTFIEKGVNETRRRIIPNKS